MTITRGNIEDLHQIYKNYERDFPENERKTLVQLEFLMRTGTYNLLLAYDETCDERMVYAFVFPVLETITEPHTKAEIRVMYITRCL